MSAQNIPTLLAAGILAVGMVLAALVGVWAAPLVHEVEDFVHKLPSMDIPESMNAPEPTPQTERS